jgi:hypothetical protein
MTNLEKVKKIAKKVRAAFEEIEEKEYGSKYTDLGGYCGRASVQLYLACRRAGITIGLHEGYGHMFNTYNGRIIDITATQFGINKKVYVKKIDKSLEDYHTTEAIHKSAKPAECVYGCPADTIRDKRTVLKYLKGVKS